MVRVFLRFTLGLLAMFSLGGPQVTQAQDGTRLGEWGKATRAVVHQLVGDDCIAYLGFEPKLRTFSHPLPHASVTRGGKIAISSGMLNLIRSQSELAFLLAHELGHVVLDHHEGHSPQTALTGSANSEQGLERELQADLYAFKMLAEAGFDRSAPVSLLSRLAQFGEHNGTSMGDLHPGLKHRARALQAASAK